MAGKDSKKTVEPIPHKDAIPTAEYQSVIQKEEQKPVRVVYARGVSVHARKLFN